MGGRDLTMETERIRQIPPALTVKINKAEEMNYDPAAAAGCGGQPQQGWWNQGGQGCNFGSFSPIPTGCCHVTLIYWLILPMAGRNMAKYNPFDFLVFRNFIAHILVSSASNDGTVDNILSRLHFYCDTHCTSLQKLPRNHQLEYHVTRSSNQIQNSES